MLTMFFANRHSVAKASKSRGFGLLELMLGVAIIAILATIAVPEFRSILQGIQVRNAAESVANGLQKARAEAVSRNKLVAFTLGADADGTRSDWTVSVVSPALVIETRTSKEGSSSVTRTVAPAGATTVIFNGLGLATGVATQLARVNFAAVDANGTLRVEIGAGGNAKMCDPSVSTGTRKCDY